MNALLIIYFKIVISLKSRAFHLKHYYKKLKYDRNKKTRQQKKNCISGA